MKYFSFVALYQPVNQVLAKSGGGENTTNLGAFALQYSDELIAVSCLILLVLRSGIGVFYKTPVYGGKPLSLWLKAPICVAGGFIAFLYSLYLDKSLTLLTPIWVGGVSFIAPAIIHLVHAALIKHFGFEAGMEPALKKLESDRSAEG
jgi:hypothetical protein